MNTSAALPLAGKTVLLTGAARRLGAVMARRFHACGASVAIHYRSSAAAAAALVAELNAARPASAVALRANLLTIPALMQSGVAAVLVQVQAENPLFVNNIHGTVEYLQFFGVGVIVMAILMTTMMGGGIALIRDRELGITEGYLVTPVKRSSIILGTIGSGTVRAFLAGFLIFAVNIIIDGVLVKGAASFALVLLVLLMTSIGVTSLVVALSSRFSNQQEYASTIAFFNLLLFMTSGAFYPVIGIPGWLSWITVINPEYYAVPALRSIILRGQGINVIGTDLIALAIFSLGAIALGIMTYRRTLE